MLGARERRPLAEQRTGTGPRSSRRTSLGKAPLPDLGPDLLTTIGLSEFRAVIPLIRTSVDRAVCPGRAI